MMRQTFIEAGRSLRRDWHMNVLFVVLLSVLLWASVIVLSAQMDLPAQPLPASNIGVHFFYQASTSKTEKNRSRIQKDNMMLEASAIGHMQRAVEALRGLEAGDFLRCQENAVAIPAEQLLVKIAEPQLAPYLANPYYVSDAWQEMQRKHPEKTMDEIGALLPGQTQSTSVSQHYALRVPTVNVTAFKVDAQAMQTFGLEAQSGRSFRAQDFVLRSPGQEISVMMGSAYADVYAPGESFTLFDAMMHLTVSARVIGFLPEGASVQTVDIGTKEMEASGLDYAIVVPIFDITYTPQDLVEERAISLNYHTPLYEGAAIAISKETDRHTITALQAQVKDILLQHGVAPLMVGTPSYGFVYFQNETQAAVRLLMGLYAIMIVFSTIAACLFFLAKANRNLRRFAIQVMCGWRLSTIIATQILEICILVLLSMLVVGVSFAQQIANNPAFLLPPLGIALLLVVVVSALIWKKLKAIELAGLMKEAQT